MGNGSKEDEKVADLEEALDVAGLGWCNLRQCIVQSLILISAILEVQGYAYALPAGKCDLNMTDSQRGLISSLPFIAIIITSFMWGYVVDTLGRKRAVIYSSLAAGGFGVLASFMPNLVLFTTVKFLASLCIACPSSTPYTIIGEIVPKKHRDFMLSVTNAQQILGAVTAPVFAWLVLMLEFRVNFGLYYFRPWRLLSALYSSMLFLSGCLMCLGQETPKYLMSQGKHDEALTVLRNFYAGNKKKSPNDYPIRHIKLMENSKRVKSENFLTSVKTQSLPLLRPPYLKWLLLNGFLLFGLFSILNGLMMWFPDILNRVLTGKSSGMTACQVIAQKQNETLLDGSECDDSMEQETFVIRVVANVTCAAIAIAISSTINFIGKKALLIIMYFLMGIFCILSDIVKQKIVFAILLSALQLTVVCIGPVNAFAIGTFPTHLRGMAVSLSLMLGRLGSVFGTNVAGILINTSCEVTFYLYGGLLLVCGLLCFLLPNVNKTPAVVSKTTEQTYAKNSYDTTEVGVAE